MNVAANGLCHLIEWVSPWIICLVIGTSSRGCSVENGKVEKDRKDKEIQRGRSVKEDDT